MMVSPREKSFSPVGNSCFSVGKLEFPSKETAVSLLGNCRSKHGNDCFLKQQLSGNCRLLNFNLLTYRQKNNNYD